MVVVKH